VNHFSIEICCTQCGKELEVTGRTYIDRRDAISFDVKPCPDCEEDIKREAIEQVEKHE
jgi:hypothetical protein